MWAPRKATDWHGLARDRWQRADTLDPAGRIAAQARLRRAFGRRRSPRRIARHFPLRARRQIIERRRARTPERRAYRRLWMRRWRQTERAKWLCEQREERRRIARAQARLRSEAAREAA